MSSISDTTDDIERIPWDELTTARQRVALTIAHVHGPQTLERPSLREDVKDADDLEDIVDDKDRALTSLRYTRLLNELTHDGYLVKEHQGGTNPIIIDLEYDPTRDTRNAAPWGNVSALHILVAQVCDREGIMRDLLDEVEDPYDFKEVKDKVNEVVGRTVLQPYADPSQYCFRREGYSVVAERVERSKDTEE